ncbi:hypothetical protein QAD02_015535 [Eretmocerus hayati]|uniref:Uncharacterized protein n=1 Tax=Eretmocerus hayati TaxID=131215 RepID=A0ACC2P8J1_9HYME|nr:hypothetical protein QAD02_015535 [Eretmocerus hayati]
MFDNSGENVSGFGADLWKIIAEFLNFTMVIHNCSRETYYSLRDPENFSNMMNLIEADNLIIPVATTDIDGFDAYDFTFALTIWGNRLFTKPDYSLKRTWMLASFSNDIWCFLVLFHLLLSTMSSIIQLTSGSNETCGIKRLFLERLFLCFGALCSRGNEFFSTKKKQKIFTICTSLFSWLIVTSFSSKIYVIFTETDLLPPFVDVKSLFYDTDYKILVVEESDSYSWMKTEQEPVTAQILKSKRVEYFEDYEPMWNAACSDDHRSAVLQYSTLNIVIKLHETGIISYLHNRWHYIEHPRTPSPRPYTPITLDAIFLPLIIVMTGLGLSVAFLVIENTFYHVRVNVTQKKHKQYTNNAVRHH